MQHRICGTLPARRSIAGPLRRGSAAGSTQARPGRSFTRTSRSSPSRDFQRERSGLTTADPWLYDLFTGTEHQSVDGTFELPGSDIGVSDLLQGPPKRLAGPAHDQGRKRIAGSFSTQGNDVRVGYSRPAEGLDDVVDEIGNVGVEHAAPTLGRHVDVPEAGREETGLPGLQSLETAATRDGGIALDLREHTEPLARARQGMRRCEVESLQGEIAAREYERDTIRAGSDAHRRDPAVAPRYQTDRPDGFRGPPFGALRAGTWVAPVERNADGRVLHDFVEEDSARRVVHRSSVEQKCITGAYRPHFHDVTDRPCDQCLHHVFAARSVPRSAMDGRSGPGSEHVPRLRFSGIFQPLLRGHGVVLVNLLAEGIGRVEELDEEGEPGSGHGRHRAPEKLIAEAADQVVEAAAGEGSVRHHARLAGAIADLPRFGQRMLMRKPRLGELRSNPPVAERVVPENLFEPKRVQRVHPCLRTDHIRIHPNRQTGAARRYSA